MNICRRNPQAVRPGRRRTAGTPFWEEQGYFHAEPDPSGKPLLDRHPAAERDRRPAPGARAEQHAAGHPDPLAADAGLQRLWMPGTDHAGIATQAVVERRLFEEEKKTRHDLGREELVERIWAWKDEYEKRILGQLRQMGCSCDWDRTRFTLDDDLRPGRAADVLQPVQGRADLSAASGW